MLDHHAVPASREALATILAEMATSNAASQLVIACAAPANVGAATYTARDASRREETIRPDLAQALAAAFSDATDGFRKVETRANRLVDAMQVRWNPEDGTLVARPLHRTLIDRPIVRGH